MTHIGKYREIPITLPDGQEAHLLLDSSGRVVVSGLTLREELDVHSAFTWEKFLREGLDAHFDTRIMTTETYSGLTSSCWKQFGTSWNSGELKVPAGCAGFAIYSKNVFPYGYMSAQTKLATLTTNYQSFVMGFEDGCSMGTGIAGFWHLRVADVEHFYAAAGGMFNARKIDIVDALPADNKTAMHTYSIIISKSQAEFYIDTVPVAFFLNSPNLNFPSISYPPYAVERPFATFSPYLNSLLELGNQGDENFAVPLAPGCFRLSPGDPLPSRVHRLYNAGTTNLLADLSIPSGSVTSHPIPTFGYPDKTLCFQADQNGTLNIETLMQTGNWRTYDSVSVTANNLLRYTMTGSVTLTRVTFTPTVYPCTINDAEMIMS